MKVSVVENHNQTKNLKSADLERVFESIKTGGKQKALISEIRELVKSGGDSTEIRKLKSKLPAILFNGVFAERNNEGFRTPSELMVLDFDDESVNINGFKEHIYAMFRSPSGVGFKILFRIPEVKNDAEYKTYFYAVQKAIPQIDPSGKDIARLCYFSYDEEIFVNDWEKTKVWTDRIIPAAPTPQAKRDQARITNWQFVNTAMQMISNSFVGNRHATMLRAGMLIGGYIAGGEIDEAEAKQIIHTHIEHHSPDDCVDHIRAFNDAIAKGKLTPLTKKEIKEIVDEIERLGTLHLSIDDVRDEMEHRFQNGLESGYKLGWHELDKHYTVLLGSTTYLYSSAYSGKCLGKGTKVITYGGEFKNVEDVKVGDVLMGDDSKPKMVLSTTRGIGEMYLIKQSRGMDYMVNSEHVLSLIQTHSTKESYPKYGTVIDVSVKDYLENNTTFRKVYKGFKVPIFFPEQDVLIEPYFLGIWLGDGDSDDVSVTSMDDEVVGYIYSYAERLGMNVSHYKYKKSVGKYGINGRKSEYGKLKRQLREIGVLGNKHIPFEYVKNSRRNRLELLAGLMDSDGHKSKNSQFVITQKNERLIRDIKYLADTLGFRTSLHKTKKKSQNGTVGDYFNLSISGILGDIPCKVERKKFKNYTQSRIYTQITVEAAGIDEYYGFILDGNGRFLLEDGTVTHNSQFLNESLINLSKFYGMRHALFSPETGNAAEIYQELAQIYMQKDWKKGVMNDIDKEVAIDFLRRHFIVLDGDFFDKDLTVNDICDYVTLLERKFNQKIHTITIDPWNELKHSYSNRQDLELESELKYVRKNAKNNERHIFLVTHVRDQDGQYDKEQGFTYYHLPTFRDVAGGQTWSRKGMMMIAVWRPVVIKKDDLNEVIVAGKTIKINQTIIQVQKTKPKGYGSPGEVNLFYHAPLHSFTDSHGNHAIHPDKQFEQVQTKLIPESESYPW